MILCVWQILCDNCIKTQNIVVQMGVVQWGSSSPNGVRVVQLGLVQMGVDHREPPGDIKFSYFSLELLYWREKLCC